MSNSIRAPAKSPYTSHELPGLTSCAARIACDGIACLRIAHVSRSVMAGPIPRRRTRRAASTVDDDLFAPTFRDHLARAKVDRPRLKADNEREEPIDFRSLRDSNATWQAIAGVSAQILQRRLGHTDISTTNRYVKIAESFDVETIGVPFPSRRAFYLELPDAETSSPNAGARVHVMTGPATRSSTPSTRRQRSGHRAPSMWPPTPGLLAAPGPAGRSLATTERRWSRSSPTVEPRTRRDGGGRGELAVHGHGGEPRDARPRSPNSVSHPQ